MERRILFAAASSTVASLVPQLNVEVHQLTEPRGGDPDNVWTPLADVKPAGPQLAGAEVTYLSLDSYTPFAVTESSLRDELSAAPMEFTPAGRTDPLTFSMPGPDGTLQRFAVVESPIMEPGLAAKFPDIKTYSGVGIDDPHATLRMDVTMLGFHAQVLSPTGAYYIDPYWHLGKSAYVSYFGHDLMPTADERAFNADAGGAPMNDVLPGAPSGGATVDAAPFAGTLRTFRAAVAADGEYTAFWGGTVAQGQAAVVSAMNRVNGVYETELDIRMTLVANNSSVIYTNAATDPYSNNTNDIDANTPNLNSVIGVNNYDIGHVFTTGSGGISYLGVVGNSSFKGGSTTGLPSPTGDAFYIDYVAHEMGHEWGANHTFNTALDTGNRNASTAYEPGSGLSIMAYAGIEGSDDLAGHSIAYFHSASIDEIRSFLGTIPGVGTSTATGNNAPTISAGADYSIPTGTPFALTASGSDPDGDPLTYDWQERDKGAATRLSTADNGASPLFTQLPPSTSPTRMLPTLNSIKGGFLNTIAGGTFAAAANVLGAGTNSTSANLAERMYAVARTSNWRVIARDNRAGGGGVASDDMVLSVVNTGASFSVTSFNSATTLAGGSTQNITWNVAATTGSGINTANVKISMSTDGGNTFGTVLAASTANDGSESIVLPNVASTLVRFKVEAVGNIFFDISNANVTLTANALSATPTSVALDAGSDTGNSSSDRLTKLDNSTAGSKLSFTVSGTVSGATVVVLSDGTQIGSAVASGTSTTVLSNGTVDLTDGSHTITARQTESGKTQSVDSPGIAVTVDTVAPTLAGTSFDYNQSHQELKLTFSEDVTPTVSASDLVLTRTQDASVLPAAQIAVSNNSAQLASRFTFPGAQYQALPDGDWTATIAAANVADPAGNNPAGTLTSSSFFFVDADFDHSRTVDLTDFTVLAANFNGTSRTFSQGDANYDGTVDLTDFTILASKFNFTLAAPAAAAPLARVAAAPSPGLAPFSATPVQADEVDVLDGLRSM